MSQLPEVYCSCTVTVQSSTERGHYLGGSSAPPISRDPVTDWCVWVGVHIPHSCWEIRGNGGSKCENNLHN